MENADRNRLQPVCAYWSNSRPKTATTPFGGKPAIYGCFDWNMQPLAAQADFSDPVHHRLPRLHGKSRQSLQT